MVLSDTIFILANEKSTEWFITDIVDKLQSKHNVKFIYKDSIAPGKSVLDECCKFIYKENSRIIYLLPKHDFESDGYLKFMLQQAFYREVQDNKKYIIPIVQKDNRNIVPKHFICHDILHAESADFYNCLDERINLTSWETFEDAESRIFGIPPEFVKCRGRSKEIEDVRRLLDKEDHDVVGIKGMPGLGKTVLAKAVGSQIYLRYKNSKRNIIVYWLSLGQNPNIMQHLHIIFQDLSVSQKFGTNLEVAKRRFLEIISERNILLILDDVWDVNHISVFTAAVSKNFRILMTAREESVITKSSDSAKVYELSFLSEASSRALLLKSANISEEKVSPISILVLEILQKLKNLPLAIVLVGSSLYQQNDNISRTCWEDANDELKTPACASPLTKHTLAKDEYEHTLETAFNLSFKALKRKDCFDGNMEDLSPLQKLFLDCAVFEEDAKMPSNIFIQLQKHDSMFLLEKNCNQEHYQARHIREQLWTLCKCSLLTYVDEKKSNLFFNIHDLLLSFARQKSKELFGNVGLVNRHRNLLASYRNKVDKKEKLNAKTFNKNQFPWWVVENDDYFYHHVAYHMLKGKMPKALGSLLLSYCWMQKKMEHCNLASVHHEFLLLKDVEIYFTKSHELLHKSLLLSGSIVAKNPSCLGMQLLGSLMATNDENVLTFLEEVKLSVTDKVCLIPITPCLTLPGGFLQQAFSAYNVCAVMGLAVHETGKIFTASGDCKIRSINPKTMVETVFGIDSQSSHKSLVSCLALDSQNRFLVTGACETICPIKIWNLSGQHQNCTPLDLDMHKEYCHCMAISNDRNIIVSGHKDGSIIQWKLDFDDDNYVRVFDKHHPLPRVHNKSVIGLCFKPYLETQKHDILVSAGDDDIIVVWNLTAADEPKRSGKKWNISSNIKISPKNELIVGTKDGKIRITDLNLAPIKTLDSQVGHVLAIDISSDDKYLAVGGNNGELSLWNTFKWEFLLKIHAHSNSIYCLAFTNSDHSLVTGSSDCSVKLWSNLFNREQFPCDANVNTQHSQVVSVIVYQPDLSLWISGSWDGTIRIVNTHGDINPKFVHICSCHVTALCVNSTSSMEDLRIYVGCENGTLYLSTCNDNHYEKTLIQQNHNSSIQAMCISPNGEHLITGALDKDIFVWALSNATIVGQVKSPYFRIKQLAFETNQTSTSLVATYLDKIAKWKWDSSTGNVAEKFQENSIKLNHGFAVISCYSSKSIIFGHDENEKIRVFDMLREKGTKKHSGHEQDDIVTCMDVTSDEKFLVSGSMRGNIRILSLNTCENHICQPPQYRDMPSVSAISVLDNSGSIFFGHGNGNLWVYQVASGKLDDQEIQWMAPKYLSNIHNSPVVQLKSIDFAASTKLVIACSELDKSNSVLFQFDVDNKVCERKDIFENKSSVTSVAFTRRTDFDRVAVLISGFADGNLICTDISARCQGNEMKKVFEYKHEVAISCLTVTNELAQGLRLILIGFQNNSIALQHLSNGCLFSKISTDNYGIHYLGLAANDQMLVCYKNKFLELRDINEMVTVSKAMRPFSSTWGQIATTYKSHVLVSSTHCGLIMHDFQTHGCDIKLLGDILQDDPCRTHLNRVRHLHLVPQQDSCSDISSDLDSVLKGHSRTVSAACWMNDNHVVTGSYDHVVKLWEILLKGKAVVICEYVLEHTITSIACTPDGSKLAIGLKNGWLCLFDCKIPPSKSEEMEFLSLPET